MRRGAQRLVAGFAMLAPDVAIVACSSFSDAQPDTRDGEAGTSPDVTVIEDGGAGDAADAADPCADQATWLCDGFERDPVDLRGSAWSAVGGPFGDVTLSIDDEKARSGTRALRSRLGPDAGDGGSAHYLRRDYPSAPAAVDLSFAMLVTKIPSSPIRVAEWQFTSPDDDGGAPRVAIVVMVLESNARARLFEMIVGESGTYKETEGAPLVAGVWGLYRLRLDLVTNQARMSVEGFAQDFEATFAIKKSPPTELRFGLVFGHREAGPTEVFFDDVVLHR